MGYPLLTISKPVEYDVWYATTSTPAIIDGTTFQISKRSLIFRCPRGSNEPGNTDRDGFYAHRIPAVAASAVLGSVCAELRDTCHVA